MSNIIITVESGSDMPLDMAKRYNIAIVPMHVSFGDISKNDGDFPVTEISDYYAATKAIPKTSGCTPEDFSVVFERLHNEYPESSILHLAYSAVTTCSFQSAVIASEGCDYIACVDTKQAAAGQTAVAVRVAQELEHHPEWTLQQAAEFSRKVSSSVRMCFVPENLAFLRAGGRVSNAVALIGSVLSIHPVIEIRDGYLIATKKVRGQMEKVVSKLVKDHAENCDLEKDVLWLEYTVGLTDKIKNAAEKSAKESGFKEVNWIFAGGVITSHGGPGAFAIAGYTSKKSD